MAKLLKKTFLKIMLSKDLITVDDFAKKAGSLLPKLSRDYFESGADEERTLRRNKEAYSQFLIWPKCLVDVSKCDPSVVILGKKYRSPIFVSPFAFQKLADPDGEVATVKGISNFGGIMICSSWGTVPMEEIAANRENATVWFQLYVYKDRVTTEALIRRAERSGFEALVLTVDTPVLGRRIKDTRNAFTLPPPLKFANFAANTGEVQMPEVPVGDSGLMSYVCSQIDNSLSWETLKWLTKFTKLPIIVKGVMRPEDAEKAIQYGAKGILISNHGGRQMDSAPSTIEVLPEIVKVVQRRVPVFVDGGIRTGNDVFKAIALGAQAIFVGRPVLYGLTVGGNAGVEAVLNILHEELERTMKLSGCPSIADMQKNAKSCCGNKPFFKTLILT